MTGKKGHFIPINLKRLKERLKRSIITHLSITVVVYTILYRINNSKNRLSTELLYFNLK